MSSHTQALLHNEVLSGIHGSATVLPDAYHSTPNSLDERGGLSSVEAENRLNQYGYNELPTIEVPLWWLFFVQFTGTMPYMLELACIIALAVEDWVDFAIIFTMLCCNGYLGFHEELKAKQSLVCAIVLLSIFSFNIYILNRTSLLVRWNRR
jgi:hypothetical protein